MYTLDRTSEELIRILVNGYKRDDYTISNQDVMLPVYIENNIRDEFNKLQEVGLISKFEMWITGNWEVIIRPNLLSYFEDKEKYEKEGLSNITNIYGNISTLQLQQGTTNSIQNQTVNQGVDYAEVINIIEQIRKYDALIDLDFGDKATDLRNKVNELENLIKKKNSSKIKDVLNDIKNLAIGVGGSLIAQGIITKIGG